jgi:hypothetical protein
MTINPCRACGAMPEVACHVGLRGFWYRLTHICTTLMHSTEEAAVTAWNRDNPADDEAQAGQGEG